MERRPQEKIDAPPDSDTGNPANALPSDKAADFLARFNDAFRPGTDEGSGEPTVDLGAQPSPEAD